MTSFDRMGSAPNAKNMRPNATSGQTVRLACIVLLSFCSVFAWPQNLLRTTPETLPTTNLPIRSRNISACSSFVSSVFPSHRFYPKRFFQESPMNVYLPLLETSMKVSQSQRAKLVTRFIHFDGQTPSDKNGTNCTKTFYHIHKNGGTTMKHLALARPELKATLYYSADQQRMRDERFYLESKKIMKRIYETQQADFDGNNEAMVFSFLRDPVSRFISGLSQVVKNGKGVRLGGCMHQSKDTKQLFSCVLDQIEKNVTGAPFQILDPHIAPQSFALYQNTMGYDIAVDVFDLSFGIDAILKYHSLTLEPKQSATGFVQSKFRFVQEELTPELIQRICRVYFMDVTMLRQSKVVSDSPCLYE